MIHYITHFDANYSAQGLTMLESLWSVIRPKQVIWARAHVLRLQNEVPLPIFRNGYMTTGTLLHLMEAVQFEHGIDLFRAQEKMPYREFCWTLETVLIFDMLNKVQEGSVVVYCDADLYFFQSPELDILRMLDNGVLIGLTPHNFPKDESDKEECVGRFNFGFGMFKNCDKVKGIVRSWMMHALEGGGEFTAGHQRHLDTWPRILGDAFGEFPVGHNAGPWSKKEWKSPPISYHFHEFRRGDGRNPITLNGQQWNRTNYAIPKETIETVYQPYERALEKCLIANEH